MAPETRSEHADDSMMSRFERNGQLRFSARDAIVSVAVVLLILLLTGGGAILGAATEQAPGAEREILLALGEPANELADATPIAAAVADLTSGLSPDSQLGGGGFGGAPATESASGAIPPVTPDAFDPTALGGEVEPQQLETVLVTGDSLSTPLDLEVSRALAGSGVEVIRDPQLATGISREDLLDWGKLSTAQVAEHAADATIVFIGANEGYPMTVADGSAECCGVEWTTEYANRVRQMMSTYRQDGTARVYWVLVPTPRDPDRVEIQRVVNAAVTAAAAPWRAQVRVLDTIPTFTPGGEYTDAIEVDGREQIVRESDGIHLNELGSRLLAERVIGALDGDFEW